MKEENDEWCFDYEGDDNDDQSRYSGFLRCLRENGLQIIDHYPLEFEFKSSIYRCTLFILVRLIINPMQKSFSKLGKMTFLYKTVPVFFCMALQELNLY